MALGLHLVSAAGLVSHGDLAADGGKILPFVAVQGARVIARQADVWNINHAIAALHAADLGARMLFGADLDTAETRAGLQAQGLSVPHVIWVALARALVAAAHSGIAVQAASSFSGLHFEVIWSGNARFSRVVTATRPQHRADAALLFQLLYHHIPHGVALLVGAKRWGMTKDVHAVACAGQQHVDAIELLQEANMALAVIADQ